MNAPRNHIITRSGALTGRPVVKHVGSFTMPELRRALAFRLQQIETAGGDLRDPKVNQLARDADLIAGQILKQEKAGRYGVRLLSEERKAAIAACTGPTWWVARKFGVSKETVRRLRAEGKQ